MTLLLPSAQTFLTSLISLSPERTRQVSGDVVTQRLNYLTGRTLTESAMHREQLWVEERLGIAGRRLSPGIVEGLGVALADQTVTPGGIVIGRGRGITTQGQDVSVLKPAQVDVNAARALGATEASEASPRGLVALVLRPVSVEVERLPDSSALRLNAFEDPTQADRDALPFLDFIYQDAAELAFVDLDDALVGDTPARAANRVAYALRRIEAETPEAAIWTRDAVPLAVVFVQDDGSIAWAHRAAVARAGGLLPHHARRTPAQSLRQSMLEGVVEDTASASRTGWDGTNIAAFAQFLPPAGVLPLKCWTTAGCFPASWSIAHAPIPVSQLDAALEAASHLAPFDLDAEGERVKILVPVPDALYAADLLEPFSLPDFSAALASLRHGVGTRLALRNAYRAQAQTVQGALDLAAVSDFLTAEDDPIPGEAAFPADAPTPTLHDAEALHHLTEVYGGLSDVLFTEAQRALIDPARLAGTLVPGTDSFGTTPFIETLRAALDVANDTVDLSFNRVQAEIYRLRQIMLDNEEATKLATFPALAGLSKGSNAFAVSEGLRQHFAAQKATQQTASTVPTDTSSTAAPVFTAAPMMVMAEIDTQAIALRDTSGSKSSLLDSAAITLNAKGFALPTGLGANSTSLTFGANFAAISVVSDQNTTLIKDLVDNTRAGLVDDAILTDSKSKRTGILQAAPLPGDIRDVRNATIADRLKAPASVDAKASAVKIKADVIRQIQALDISIEGLRAPLTSARDRVLLPRDEIDAVIAATLTQAEVKEFDAEITRLRRPVSGISDEWDMMTLPAAQGTSSGVTPMTRLATALLTRKAPITMTLLPALALSKELDPDPGRADTDDSADDESAYLNSAIATLEGAIAFLRLVESRILAISKSVDSVAAKSTLLAAIQSAWGGGLASADQDLDEARHDLRVAQSLVDEETKRLEARQAEKDKILKTAVKFVAYQRPRVLTPHAQGTRLGLSLPGAVADPLPAALARDVPLPDALQRMMETLREIPIGWFSSNPELAKGFTTPAYLDHVLGNMQFRALAVAAMSPAPKLTVKQAQSPAQMQIAKISNAYSALSYSLVQTRTTFNPQILAPLPWKEKQQVALTLVSLNDLIAAGREPKVIKTANDELETIERVLAALWQSAREIPAAVRLLWATRLSEYDTVASLESLARLPGWATIDFGLRARLDRLNGWLFARMEPTPKEARALMTDIVRVAILLAAHAPVADIIAAALEEDKTVSPGATISIRIKRGTPQIGAKVSFVDAALVQAHGWIRDMSGSKAQVEIISTAQPMVVLTQTQSVTVYHAQAIGLKAV